MNTPFSKLKPADKFAAKWTTVAEDGGEMQSAHPVCKQFTGCEYQFCDDRRWRLDFAWPDLKVGVEIDGFGYGHQAQQHMATDNEKQNEGKRAI